MAKLKTRDRILITSLELFNQEGEPNVTTVDIANELDISPGNLYYHYKGKEQLVTELFAQFHEQMNRILHEPAEKPLEIADNWFYLVVVFEQIYRYRFLYRNISLIMQRYDSIQRPFRRLIAQKINTSMSICVQLRKAGVLEADDARIALLSRSIALTIPYWFNFDVLLGEHDGDDANMILDGVLQVMALIAPYLGPQDRDFMDVCLDLYRDASH
jgi:AcrR family transcriptional regulator